jgi:hypothetical protein
MADKEEVQEAENCFILGFSLQAKRIGRPCRNNQSYQ